MKRLAVNFMLSPKIHKVLKDISLETGIHMSRIAEDALLEYLKSKYNKSIERQLIKK